MSQAETEKLTEMIMGTALSRALSTVGELGVADHIEAGSPQPVEALARATGSHERSLYRILRFLASHEIFEEKERRRFDHTRLSQSLRTDAEGSFRAATRMMHRIFPAWEGIHHAALTGEPAFDKIFGKPIFEYVSTHPDLGPILDAGMTALHGHETSAMIAAYDFSGIKVLADIGGGNGSLIGSVLHHYPQLKGILFDLGHVVGRARGSLKNYEVDDRCSIIEGSFFESIPEGADAYLFRHIIHDWTDEQSIHILKKCRKVIPNNGRLLIVETVVPAGNEPSLAKLFDMAMLTFPGGVERTEEEYRTLFEQSGFSLRSVVPTASVVSVIEGAPA